MNLGDEILVTVLGHPRSRVAADEVSRQTREAWWLANR